MCAFMLFSLDFVVVAGFRYEGMLVRAMAPLGAAFADAVIFKFGSGELVAAFVAAFNVQILEHFSV